MKYLKPEMADHPLTSPRLREVVRTFYAHEAMIAEWDRKRLARKHAAEAESAQMPQSPADQADDALEELELLTRTVARMERKIEKLRQRRAKLEDKLPPLLSTLSEAEKQAREERLGLIASLEDGAKAKGQSEAAREMLAYLALTNRDEIRPIEITGHLRGIGHRVSDNYGAAMLHVWQKSGLVTRTGHGRYRVDRSHPDLVRATLLENRLTH